jgi:hypothetical protein
MVAQSKIDKWCHEKAGELAGKAHQQMMLRGYGEACLIYKDHCLDVQHEEEVLPLNFLVGLYIGSHLTKEQIYRQIYSAMRNLPILPKDFC